MEPLCWRITEAILQSILLEAATPGKPGLVCHDSNGSHSDMSILTFMSGSAALTPYFYEFVVKGYEYDGEIAALLPDLRPLGRLAEKRLLEATAGVNTQRGALFALGLLAALAGYLQRQEGRISAGRLFELSREASAGLVENELRLLKTGATTAGEQLYQRYGATGIRGEVQSGFANVERYGLPALCAALARRASLNEAVLHTLINLIAQVEDTTVLWRGGEESLELLQQKARFVWEQGSVFSAKGLQALEDLRAFCLERRLSPGGSADLVAVSLCIYLWQEGSFPVPIL